MEWLTAITRLALRKRDITFLVVGLVLLLGGLAVSRLKMELFPDIEIPTITIVSRYTGASPDAVAAQVTEPIENAIAGMPGLKRLEATSAEGLSLVIAEFEFGTDMKEAEREITASLSRLVLPEGAERPVVNRISFADFPIMALAVWGQGRSPKEIEEIVRQRVIPALEGIDGVFTVTVSGGREERLVVAVDPDRMAGRGIGVDDVVRALQDNILSLPSGFAIEGDMILPVRTLYTLDSLEALANLAVAAPPAAASSLTATSPALAGDGVVLLKDVADIGIAPSPFAAVARVNGQPSLALRIFKTKEANTVRVANKVTETLEALEGDLPADIETAVLFNQADFIEESVTSMVREGTFGAIFAIIVIMIFLTSIRATVVTAVSIPLSVLAALALLHWQGATLNIMTMGGLTVAIGRVVDDSIVVLENIYVHSRRGKGLWEAAVDGTREVATAIFSSTLTTVAVFLPLAFIGGLVSEAFLPFAQAVTFALLASLVVALTVVPALAVVVIPALGVHEGETWLQRLYVPVLRWCLGHRALTLVAAAALFFASFALLPFINFSFLPSAGPKVLVGRVAMPTGTAPWATDQRAQEIEQHLAQVEALKTYQVIIGEVDPSVPQSFRGGLPGANVIDLTLVYDDGADLEREEEALRRFLEGFADMRVNVTNLQAGGMVSDRVEVVVSGSDPDAVAATAGRITAALRGVPELKNVANNLAEASPELYVMVDPTRAAAYGLTAQAVSREVRQLLVGRSLGTVNLGEEALPLVVRIGQQRGVPAQVVGKLILGGAGGPRLEEIAQVSTAQGPASITRVDQQRAVTITADISSSDISGVSAKVQDLVNAVDKEPGVEVHIGGIFQRQREAFSDLYVAMAVGVALVYVVMVASLGSLRNPFIIIFSLPFVTIGSFLALFITGRDLGLPALMGFLMLIGIVVTNAIVLITFVEMLRGRGLSVREALLQGGRSRVRPILMTALATIFALVPLSLGLSQGIIIAAELATVVIGGLFTSTVLTLIVIPVIYSLVVRERRA